MSNLQLYVKAFLENFNKIKHDIYVDKAWKLLTLSDSKRLLAPCQTATFFGSSRFVVGEELKG